MNADAAVWIVGVALAALLGAGIKLLLDEARRTFRELTELKTAVVGMDGHGGLASEVATLRAWRHDDVAPTLADHENRIGALEADGGESRSRPRPPRGR